MVDVLIVGAVIAVEAVIFVPLIVVADKLVAVTDPVDKLVFERLVISPTSADKLEVLNSSELISLTFTVDALMVGTLRDVTAVMVVVLRVVVLIAVADILIVEKLVFERLVISPVIADRLEVFTN